MTATTTTLMSIDRDRLRQASNVVLSVGQLLAIAVAVASENGADLPSRSAAEPPVVPAEYAFAIWSLIYPASIAYAIYQALPRKRDDELLRRIGFWTASAFLGMTLWANAVQLGWRWLTVVFIVWILLALTGAFIQIIQFGAPRTTAERLLVVAPISVHLGWITVATIANTASVLTAYGFTNVGLADGTWAIVMLVAASLIGSFVTLVSRGNAWYTLAVIWALVGIFAANLDSNPNVALTAAVAAGLMAVALLAARGQPAR